MKTIPKFLAVVIIACLSGCSNESPVEERGEFWSSSVQSFFEEDRTIEDLDDWLATSGAEPLRESENVHDMLRAAKDPTFEPNNSFFSWLEMIELDGFVCASWHYGLEVWADESGKILRYEIQSSGNCL